MKTFLISFFLVLSLEAKECDQTRIVVEIGSFSTKMTSALIDQCKNKIKKINLSKRLILNFKESMGNKRPLQFNQAFLDKAENQINEGLKEIKDITKGKTLILSNRLLDDTTNGKTFLRKLKKAHQAKVLFPSNQTNSILNFLATYAILEGNPEEYTIWDIGASGMEITLFEKGIYHIHTDNLSSVNFKNMILNAVKKKTHLKTNSPNPLSEEEVKASIEMIRLYSRFELKNEFINLSKKRILIGIGGVLNNTLKNFISKDKHYYSIDEIKKAIDVHTNKNDIKIDGISPETQMTNLIMIYGQMLEMGHQTVLTIKSEKTQAALLYPSFWK